MRSSSGLWAAISVIKWDGVCKGVMRMLLQVQVQSKHGTCVAQDRQARSQQAIQLRPAGLLPAFNNTVQPRKHSPKKQMGRSHMTPLRLSR